MSIWRGKEDSRRNLLEQGGGRREDGRENLLEQGGGRKERGQQGDLVFTTFGSAEGGHARKYSNKFGISLTYP
ncbi:MAG: hypothetical protein ACI3ZJ_11330 [Bacteroidaceae bacterium]